MKLIIKNKFEPCEDIYFLLSFVIYTLLIFLPWINSFSAIYIRMPIMLVSYFFLLVSVENRKGKPMVDKIILLSIGIILFNYFFIYLQDEYIDSTLVNKIGLNYSLFVTMFPVLIVASDGIKGINRKRFINFFIFLILFICVCTIVGTFRYESPCRALATTHNISLNTKYRREGIGGYGFIYFLALFCPILIGRIKDHFSIFYTCTLGIVFICILKSEYAIAIGLAMAATFATLIIKKKYSLGLFVILFTVVLAYCFREEIVLLAISYFEERSWSITYRLNSLLGFIRKEGMNGDISERMNHYLVSFNSFVRNPLFGSFFRRGSNVGGHSEIMDLVGHSGVLGGFVLFMIISKIKKTDSFSMIQIKPYHVIMYFEAFILAIVNTFLAPELFYSILIVPLLFGDSKNNTENTMQKKSETGLIKEQGKR